MKNATRQALNAWSTVVAVFGLALCGAAFAPTDGFARWAFGLLGHADAAFTPELRFAVALMGAVTFGWGLTLLTVAMVTELLDQAAAVLLWRRMTAAIGAWYAIDSALSIATGFALNAVSNTVLMLALLGIMWRGGLLAPVGRPVRPLSREGGMG